MKTNLFRGKFAGLLPILVAVALVFIACGPKAPPTPVAPPPPPRSATTAARESAAGNFQCEPGSNSNCSRGTIRIHCVASDPDGDGVSFSWTATEGTITGVGNKITWQAPSKEGDFYVKVLVGDGKGGSTTSQVLIRVATAQRTVVVNVTEQETGTVWNDGSVQREPIAVMTRITGPPGLLQLQHFPLCWQDGYQRQANFHYQVCCGQPLPRCRGE